MLSLAALLFTTCEKAETFYARHAARLNYNLVSTTPPLFHAVSGRGQFCAINYRPSSSSSYIYTFVSAIGESHTSAPVSVTLSGVPSSIAGFFVGTPQLLNLSGQQALVAFDRVCPTCYEEALVQRSLVFLPQSGWVKCPRCQRVYDLNNGGVVVQGAAGVKLYRYHATSTLTLLSIWN